MIGHINKLRAAPDSWKYAELQDSEPNVISPDSLWRNLC